MAQMVRKLNPTDKSYLSVCLMNAGIKKFRIRKFTTCYRLVFEGDRETVRNVLNNEGYLPANGQEYAPDFSFWQEANEVHIRYARAY